MTYCDTFCLYTHDFRIALEPQKGSQLVRNWHKHFYNVNFHILHQCIGTCVNVICIYDVINHVYDILLFLFFLLASLTVMLSRLS
mgnify:CR=1 FL=1